MNKFPERLAKALKKNPRLHEEDETKYPWLAILLDTYHIYDTGLKIELVEEEKKRGAQIACGKGCVACCLHPSAPATELEVMGIWWFVLSKLDSESRTILSQRLLNHRQNAECPFLINKTCIIYPLRPLACRILHAFGTQCPTDAIIIEAKGKDIWIPSRDVGLKAARTMLAYFGFTHTQDKVRAFNEGFIPAHSHPILEINWESLAKAGQKTDEP